MSDKVNELVCPTCGLRCFTKCAYATCDGCQTLFYASESAHKKPITVTETTIIRWRPGR